MIRFALACAGAHRFEAWFASSVAFDQQRAGALVLCPVCGSAEVGKALMTPSVAPSRAAEPLKVAVPAPENAEAVATLRKLRQHLTENAEYVGDQFAKEARRIHYDEVEKRGIYGEASADEVKALAEEGIGFHPLPTLPEDHN